MYTRDNAQFSCLNSISCLTPVCCEKLRCIIRHPLKISSTLVCIENRSHIYRRGRNNQDAQNSSTETLNQKDCEEENTCVCWMIRSEWGIFMHFHDVPMQQQCYKRGFQNRSSHSSTCCQEACQCSFSIGLVICTVRVWRTYCWEAWIYVFSGSICLICWSSTRFHQFPSRHQSSRE